MKTAKILSILGLSFALSFLFEPLTSAQLAPVVKRPMITHAFAVKNLLHWNQE